MRTVLGSLVAMLVVVAGTTEPAQAATTPPKVGLVSFVAASYSASKGTAGLTIDWPGARHATSYQVYLSRAYSMSGARRYTATRSAKAFTGLKPGTNYFVQVRALNGRKAGKKSVRVGHATPRRVLPSTGPAYRVMTYNLCTQKCSGWPTRQPAALARIRAYAPDVVAAQEAGGLATPAGYAEAIPSPNSGAKRLLYKTSRLAVVPPGPGVGPQPAKDGHGCYPSWPQSTKGYVFLGFHDGGCRYAVWAVLADTATRNQTVFVDVHTVAGGSDTAARLRTAETTTLVREMSVVNAQAKLPVVYAGDFNSHKHRRNDDLAKVLHRQGYYDAFDLALKLRHQHINSYNGFAAVPRISYTWGDHVDHVWIRPDEGRVLSWTNGALIRGNRMVKPIPSDHSPVVVDIRLNR